MTVQISNPQKYHISFFSDIAGQTVHTSPKFMLALIGPRFNEPYSYYKWFNNGSAYNIHLKDTIKHTWEVEANGTLKMDGNVIIRDTSYGGEVDTPLTLFYRAGYTEATSYFEGYFFDFSCGYDDPSDFKAELVPCYRRLDNKPGAYDLKGSICPLTETPFYINASSGDDFTVGPDVN